MKSTQGWLSLLFGTLSMVMLVRYGFEVSFVSSLQIVLDYYEQALQLLFGWAEPWIREQLRVLGTWLGWEFHLYPHWKHVLVIMSLYFGAHTRVLADSKMPGAAIFTALWGGLVAVVSSLGSGVVSIDDASRLSAIFPVLGFVAYELGQAIWTSTFARNARDTWWQSIGYYLPRYALANAAIGLLALLLTRAWEHPNLSALAVYLGGLVLRNLAVSAWNAERDRVDGQGRVDHFLKFKTVRLGLLILRTLIATAFFILTNAGLKLAGF